MQHALKSDIVQVERHACLMSCDRPCAVAITCPHKMSYVLAGFLPEAASADAILAFVRLYADSDTGVVPYRLWPEGIKGHFAARIPPLGA